ncbi:Uncharacterized protein OBRU01_13944 [Operophtera brumata]|uniref:Uncharacterized protein n=1 Tax=Operophtera brumata TaxID=104452 RepID=A0A0L7L7G2_OPEBR|nr:Uncharacterized protein OBRU01_13944 [Operophtera brumata]
MRRYRPAWEAEPKFSGWLTSLKGDGTKAFCKLCKCTLQAHKKDLSNHASCKKHIQAFKFSQMGASNVKLTKFYEANIPKERKIAELKLAAFIAEHCSMAAVDHLGELLPSLDKTSELLCGIKLHHTKCTGLITNIISPCMLAELLHDIGDSPYSMIIDESTSIDTKKMLCMIVRYYSQTSKKLVTTFYRLLEIEGGDADSLTDAFKKQLAMDGLDIKKLIGIGVDGANVMVGEHHSFRSILKESLPHLTTVKCVSHSLHLAAEHACKVLPSHLEYIVREVHNWFSCSTKRQIEYALLHETLVGKKPLKIDKLSGTRWLARIGAITKILDQWDALELHFLLAKEKERCFTAGQLHLMLSSKPNQLYLRFLRHSLKPTTDCNRMFQADNVEPLKLLTELHGLLLNYLSILVPPERLNNVRRQDLAGFNFRDHVMNINCINLGYSFNEAAAVIDQNELRLIKERCVLFLCEISHEIQKIIPRNLNLLEIIAFFTPDSATSQVRPDVGDIVWPILKT